MSLSNVDKQRIYEEEKVRFESRKQLEKEDSKNNIVGGIFGLFLLALIFVITWNILS